MTKIYASWLDREFDSETLEDKYGTVEADGKKLWLTQDAYVDSETYTAMAIDEEGNDYTVTWETLEDYDENNDEEGDACDWTKYSVSNNRLEK